MLLTTAVIACAALAGLQQEPSPQPGYLDTPTLPSGWHVHDSRRPRPPVVDPGPAPAAPASVPADAVRLFDGANLDAFRGKDGAAKWELVDGAMQVNGTGDIWTRQEFGDCQLHVEWATPRPAKGSSQGRGNSGVFLFGRYEIQVLDSYDNATYADGQAAAIYGQTPPLVNACRAPGEWQTYDIIFVAPRFGADGKLSSPARVTVIHNGVLVQLDQEVLGMTAHRTLPRYEAHGPTGPIKLQDHGDPVRYRNLWVRPLDFARPAAPK
ncbi:MAG TPA: DUF1080 domain-containing protein [Planctomycetota bacterium]|nr:DUF1080 domain-containing protein [Planctomycetota bacterium]